MKPGVIVNLLQLYINVFVNIVKKIVEDEIPFLLVCPAYKEFGYFDKNKYPKVVFVICLFLKKSRGRYEYKNIWHASTIVHRQKIFNL